MKTTINKTPITLVLVASLALVVSGCLKKPVTPPVNQNQNINAATTTSEIDTSDWKTYRNETIGVEFDYPTSWPRLDSENRGNSDGTSFSLHELPELSALGSGYDNLPIDEEYANIKCKPGDTFDIVCEERISDYGVKYVWRVGKTPGDPTYTALVPTGKYTLVFDFAEKENYEKRASEYEAVLRSLRLVNSDQKLDISAWKTYRNEAYGFEFKYPGEWSIINLPDPKAGYALRSVNYNNIKDGPVTLSGEIYFKVISNPSNLSILELFNTFSDASRFWPSKYIFETKEIAGSREAIIFPSIYENGLSQRSFYMTMDKKVLSISYIYKTEDKSIIKIFDTIIDTTQVLN